MQTILCQLSDFGARYQEHHAAQRLSVKASERSDLRLMTQSLYHQVLGHSPRNGETCSQGTWERTEGEAKTVINTLYDDGAHRITSNSGRFR